MKFYEPLLTIGFLFALVLLGPPSFAGSTLKIDQLNDIQDITKFVETSWQDPQATHIDQFKFDRSESDDLNVKYSNKVLWLKLTLENSNPQSIEKVLFFTSYIVGELTLFDRQLTKLQVSGSAVPFFDRSFRSRMSAFKIQIRPHDNRTIFIRRISHQSLSTRIKLADQSTFMSLEADEKATLFFYAGGIFCLMIFNLFIGLYTKDRDFLYYSFFAGTVAITVLSLHGVLDSYTFNLYYTTLAQRIMCFSSAAVFSALVFANRFFNLSRYLPRALMVFKAIGALAVVTFIYGLFFQFENAWPFMGFLIDLMLVSTLAILIIVAFVVSKRGSKSAQFFLFSWAFLFLGLMAYFGVLYGVLPNIPIFYNGILFGNLIEMLVISLGLAYKLNVLDFEKRQAQKEAAEKDHYHRLVKVLSHDISNASSIFSMYFFKLKKYISDPQCEILFNKIDGTLSKMNQILDSVRNEQAFKSFERTLQLAHVNLNEVVSEVLHFYEDHFELKNLQVEFDVSAKAIVMADRSALANQVISNIISNAIKFSKPNSKLLIKLSECHTQNKLMIEDFGIGIPQDRIQRIFFSDSMISTQGTNFEKGSGIGCSLIREYMRLFRGSLEVESQTAEGLVCDADFLSGTKITLIFPKVDS